MTWPWGYTDTIAKSAAKTALQALKEGQQQGPHEVKHTDERARSIDHAVGSTWWLRQKVEALEERLTKLEKNEPNTD